MATNDPATQDDIDNLDYRLDYTEIAIGLILAALSKKIDLKPIFEEALQEAERLKTSKSVPRIIVKIRDSVENAEARVDKAGRRTRVD